MERREVSFAELTPLLEEFLAAGKSVEFTPKGASMEPLLHSNRSVVRLIRADEVRRGDIVLYRRHSKKYVLHRIAKCDADGTYAMCGDGQWHFESGIRREQILGVVTAFSRDGEKWIDCTQPVYQAYWRFWLWIRPLRHLIFGGERRLRRLLFQTK